MKIKDGKGISVKSGLSCPETCAANVLKRKLNLSVFVLPKDEVGSEIWVFKLVPMSMIYPITG